MARRTIGQASSAPASGRRDGKPVRGDTPASENGKKPVRTDTPAPWLQTLRIDLREFVPGDFADLCRLDADPRVVRYVGNGKPVPPADVARMLARIMRYGTLYPDLGIWYATRRDTGAFIGWFSLKYCGKSAEVEIGYRLLQDAWGQGFATEGATALLHYGFDDLALERIIGVTHPDNRASQHVLQKAGLADAGWGRYYDRRLRLFVALR